MLEFFTNLGFFLSNHVPFGWASDCLAEVLPNPGNTSEMYLVLEGSHFHQMASFKL